MRDEASKAFERYLGKEVDTILFLGSIRKVEIIDDVLLNGQIISRDAPDMLCLKGEIALIIEHFEFDCFRTGKKGSENKREQARINAERKSFKIPEDGLIFKDLIRGKSSYESYVKNFTMAFASHYKKIGRYKQNLLKDGLITPETTVKVAFLIEDVSPLPCEYKERINGRLKTSLIELAHSPEFLELFENSTALDYVFACSGTSDGDRVWFIDRTEIPYYKKESVDYKNKEFIAWEPYVGVLVSTIKNR